MSRNLESASTRSRVLRITGLVAAFGLAAGTLFADQPPTAKEKETGASKGPILGLQDGGFVAGALEDCGRSGMVLWKSPVFAKPLEFPLDSVQSIRFPVLDKLPRPTGAFGFELTGGDIFYGSIVSLDDKKVEVDVAKFGKIAFDRSRLRRIFRWKDGGDLVYNGPNGLAGWTEIAPPKKAAPQNAQNIAFFNGRAAQPAKPAAPSGPKWVEEGGQLHAVKNLATIQGNVDLPAQASVELELSWKAKPDFVLALAVDDTDDSVAHAFRIEVWDGQVVAVRTTETKADLVSLLTLADGPGRLVLHLFLDQAAGKLLVFSSGGEPLGTLTLPGKPGPPLTKIRLTNIKGDLRLERLRVGHWDGETPRPVDPNLARVQLIDHSNARGKIERFDPEKREFVVEAAEDEEETRVPEDKVANVFLPQPADLPNRSLRAVYQDGTRIGGEWTKVEGGTLVIDSPGVVGPIRLPMDGLRSLDVTRPDAVPRPKPEIVGTIEADGLKLIGKLVDSGGNPGEPALAWRPLAADAGSPIRPGTSARVFYTKPPPPPPKPAQPANQPVRRRNLVGVLIDAFNPVVEDVPAQAPNQAKPNDKKMLYLRSGDIIPAEVVKIDDKGVTFKTELSLSSFVPNERVKAVEIAPDAPNAMRLTKAKFERLLTLPRMQRESPPTHLIRSKNGDMLRARITEMDDKTMKVEVRLEEKEVPRDRVARIVWLHPDEVDPSKKKPAKPEENGTEERVQVVRSDGIRLTFRPERFADDTLSGKSDVLGECKVRVQEVDQLLIGGQVEKESTQLAYQTWKLVNAPDPVSAREDAEGSPGGGAAGTESPMVGKPAPDFELTLLSGAKFHLADQKGKVIVLDFWATWCGPCLQAMPQVDKATHEFADKGVQLIAVNLQETPEKIKGLLERIRLSPTVALDRDGVVAQRYAANAIPQTVVIDKEGKVARLFIGSSPKLGEQLREALQALTAEDKK